MEQTLAENGMPAECMAEHFIYTTISYGEYESKTAILQGTGTTMDMYTFAKWAFIEPTRRQPDKPKGGRPVSAILQINSEGTQEYMLHKKWKTAKH